MPAPLRIAAAALLVAAACNEKGRTTPPPLDLFIYPTGLATHRLSPTQTALLVVSTNYDLRYDPQSGGVLQSVDPATGAALGAVRVGSMGGTVAVVDDTTCPGAAGPQVLLASRYVRALYRAGLDGASGALACGPDCVVPLAPNVDDPFRVEIACRGDRHHAYVSYLGASGGRGVLTRLDLDTGGEEHLASMSAIPYGLAYEAERDRLWTAEHALGIAIVSELELGVPCDPARFTCPLRNVYDVWPYLRGAEPRGIALSTPQAGMRRRLYLATRVYDADYAAAIASRPSFDVGSVLLVLDVEDGPNGFPPSPLPLVRAVPLGTGASEVRVLPRAGQRDLVVVTSQLEGTLTIYDDELGAVVKVFALAEDASGSQNPAGAPVGSPLVGKQPFGLAVESREGRGWIYVAGFRSNTVTAVSLDPAQPSEARIEWMRTGVTP